MRAVVFNAWLSAGGQRPVGEYHKRFDRRSLIARRHYELGNYGTFAIGEARMIDPGSALRYLGTQVDSIDVVFASPGTVTLPEQVT